MFPHTNEIKVEFIKGYPRGLPSLATLAEKGLLLQTEAKTQNRNYLKKISTKPLTCKIPTSCFHTKQQCSLEGLRDIFQE